MMMYDETGLEPEAEYDDEYVGSSSSENISTPVYNPMPPYSAVNDSRYLQLTSDVNHSQRTENQISNDNVNSSHIYQQLPQPQIKQVFEEYNPTTNHNYAQIDTPMHQAHPEIFSYNGEEQTRLILPKRGPPLDRFVVNHTSTIPLSNPSTSGESKLPSSDINSTSSIPNPAKMTSLFVHGIIPTLQTPTARIPKKKKIETEQQISSKMDMFDDMRIDTREGWTKCCALMKDAENKKDFIRMAQFLKKCLQHDISLDFLLSSNEIPRTVKKLSKTHENQEIKDLALQCYTKWKSLSIENKGDESSKKTEKRRLSDEADKKKQKKSSLSKDNESPEKKKKKEETKNSKPTPRKVQAASLSSGFMDALTTSEPRKRPAPKKKQIINDPLSVLDIIDNEKNKPEVTAPGVRRKSSTPPPEDIEVKANRKIKFADECGKEMVEIRYFEIEEGERINVNRLTPEEMKHHEVMMEREFKSQASVEEEEEKESNTVPWRLISLDEESISPYDNQRGSKSEEKLIEERRQQSILKPFYDPTRPIYIMDDPVDYDPRAVYPPPKEIPLYRSGEEVKGQLNLVNATNLPVVAAAAALAESKAGEDTRHLPDHLKNLLGALKKTGIVSEQAGPTQSIANLISSTGVSSILSTVASTQPGYPTATFTQAPVQQYQQTPQPYSQQFPPIQYQRQFPPAQAIQTPIASTSAGNPQQRQINMGARPSRHCDRFQAGFCRFGDRCHFIHDQNALANRNSRGGGNYRGRGRPYDRRDTYDRRDDRRDTSWRDQRDSRNPYYSEPKPDRYPGSMSSPPQSAQSPSIQSPDFLSPASSQKEKVITIPSERVD